MASLGFSGCRSGIADFHFHATQTNRPAATCRRRGPLGHRGNGTSREGDFRQALYIGKTNDDHSDALCTKQRCVHSFTEHDHSQRGGSFSPISKLTHDFIPTYIHFGHKHVRVCAA